MGRNRTMQGEERVRDRKLRKGKKRMWREKKWVKRGKDRERKSVGR